MFYVDAPAEEQRREVCVLRKGYVAWKSHTDPKKWRPNCDVPFSVVAPLCRSEWCLRWRDEVCHRDSSFPHSPWGEGKSMPWRGASCGVFPHPTIYLNTVMASCFITVSSSVNWAQQQNLLYGQLWEWNQRIYGKCFAQYLLLWLLFAKSEQFIWSFIMHLHDLLNTRR